MVPTAARTEVVKALEGLARVKAGALSLAAKAGFWTSREQLCMCETAETEVDLVLRQEAATLEAMAGLGGVSVSRT